MLEIIVTISVTIILYFVASHFSLNAGEKHLKNWAIKNKLTITSCVYHHHNFGPFQKELFFSRGGYSIYEFKVKDEFGKEKNGFARVGGYHLGLFSDSVEVKWVE